MINFIDIRYNHVFRKNHQLNQLVKLCKLNKMYICRTIAYIYCYRYDNWVKFLWNLFQNVDNGNLQLRFDQIIKQLIIFRPLTTGKQEFPLKLEENEMECQWYRARPVSRSFATLYPLRRESGSAATSFPHRMNVARTSGSLERAFHKRRIRKRLGL